MKTMFTYAHVKWFYGQSEHAYFELFYNMQYVIETLWSTSKMNVSLEKQLHFM